MCAFYYCLISRKVNLNCEIVCKNVKSFSIHYSNNTTCRFFKYPNSRSVYGSILFHLNTVFTIFIIFRKTIQSSRTNVLILLPPLQVLLYINYILHSSLYSSQSSESELQIQPHYPGIQRGRQGNVLPHYTAKGSLDKVSEVLFSFAIIKLSLSPCIPAVCRYFSVSSTQFGGQQSSGNSSKYTEINFLNVPSLSLLPA